LPTTFKLVCTSLSSDEVLDNIIPRKFNPRLIELVNKYALTPPKSNRTTRIWYNEEDASVLFEYRDEGTPLEASIVNAIYSYRDLFLKRVIDLNFFRHGLAILATSIMHKNLDLYSGIVNLLKILGCDIVVFETPLLYEPSSQEIERSFKGLERILDVRQGVTSVVLKVRSKILNKPLPGKRIHIRYIVPTEKGKEEYNAATETDEKGEAKISASKYSILFVKLEGAKEEKKIIVGDREAVETLQFLDFKADILPVLTITGLAGVLITILLLLFP
jgi:predicted thioesterase